MRRAYKTEFCFFQDSDEPTEIRWYKVPDDRPFLPVGTYVHSWDWDEDNAQHTRTPGTIGPVGEQLGAVRAYQNGSDPLHIPFTKHYCGTESQWMGDMLASRPEDLGTLNPDGVPTCCAGPAPQCPLLPNGGLETYNFDIALGPDVCFDNAQFSGHWTLQRRDPCFWRATVTRPLICVDEGTEATYVLQFIDPVTLNLELVFKLPGGAESAALDYNADVSAWDGFSPLIMALSGIPLPFYAPPATVTLFPGP